MAGPDRQRRHRRRRQSRQNVARPEGRQRKVLRGRFESRFPLSNIHSVLGLVLKVNCKCFSHCFKESIMSLTVYFCLTSVV